jgi:NADPH:quinone reductase-like Zn-dependent oxidoreductase
MSTTTVETSTALLNEPPIYKTYQSSRALVLQSAAGPYIFVDNWPKPFHSPREILVKIYAIGLNPIDWKCVVYKFGVHSTPWISGREGAGVIEEVGSEVTGVRKGDRVFVTSTNYRDNRTSTFQEVRSYFLEVKAAPS